MHERLIAHGLHDLGRFSGQNLVRQFSSHQAPGQEPDHAGGANNDEHAAPIILVQDDESYERSDGRSQFRSRVDQAVRGASQALWETDHHHFGVRRIGDGFAEAQQETQYDELPEDIRQTRNTSRRRPKEEGQCVKPVHIPPIDELGCAQLRQSVGE